MLRLGIVGLPNVGKSTLFNALTSAGVLAANYPFATKDPNVGRVNVPDSRLDVLADLVKPEKTTPAAVEFVDIAGLVKGASQGEGLGNQFLANIRETDAIVHVVRAFEDDDVLHVMGNVDPVRDREVIEFELALADLSVVEKRLDRVRRTSKTGDKDALAELGSLERANTTLAEGRALWHTRLSDGDRSVLGPLSLLTLKPILYAANVTDAELSGEEGAHIRALRKAVADSGEHAEVVSFSAKIEAELSELGVDEKKEFLESLGIESAGLDRLIRAGYHLLGLQTYFTAGEQEVRAWTINRGFTAPQAAGVIHTDFERGFIKAEVIWWEDLVKLGSEAACRANAKLNLEGKDYVVRDGDVIHFKFNV